MKKTNESGRSMVEMLGVLAIIGVLSIGGIAGYSMAMNRYRANEALDMANKYAVIVFSGYHTAKAMNNTSTSYTPPTLKDSGLTTDEKTPGGAKITYSDSSDADLQKGIVKLTIEFPTEAVCNAAKSILGIGTSSSTTTDGCTSSASCSSTSGSGDSSNGGSITYCFRQS